MVYRKNQRKKSLMVCIVFTMLFILGVTAGTITYAYFSDSAKAENTLNFGKLRIATVKNGASEYVNVKLSGADKLAVNDNVKLNGSVGLEDNSVSAYKRMRMVVKDNELNAEIGSTFTNAFLTAMESITSKDKSNVEMKWFVVGEYLYLGNKIVAGSPFTYNNNIQLTDPMIPKQFQGLDIQVTFIFEAIQSAGMDAGVTGSDYRKENAEKISGISAWNKLFEPELNTIYSGKYATNYIRGDLDETIYRAEGHKETYQIPKSPYNYFARSKDNSKGNYVAFGFFPQTIKANDVYIYETKTYEFGGSGSIYYKGSDGYLYEKVKENGFNVNYKYSNEENINQASANSYRYFKLEPIIWQVLTESNGSAFLFSVSALTASKFGDSSTYTGSTIDNYLKGNFYNKAFTSSAKGKINNKVNVVTATSGNGTGDETTIGTNTTNSTVFLLGYKDVINPNYGFNTTALAVDEARTKFLTDYAGANRGNIEDTKTIGKNGSWWWLRSRVDDTHNRSVYRDGWVAGTGGVGSSDGGIVPALYLNINN